MTDDYYASTICAKGGIAEGTTTFTFHVSYLIYVSIIISLFCPLLVLSPATDSDAVISTAKHQVAAIVAEVGRVGPRVCVVPRWGDYFCSCPFSYCALAKYFDATTRRDDYMAAIRANANC